ncbi:hypothetical protein DFH29DRAFT_927594 [Suillus ampliporus]|nr:hypothetical protein DFH29DRAFT_927594 [Suillus ampliporus]
MDDFVAWFQHHGGVLDTSMMGVADFPGSGHIPENHTIFTLPRALTLSTLTSTLPSALGIGAWRKHNYTRVGVGLILYKLGRVEAERDYHEKLVPAIKTRPDLFPSDKIDTWYTLHRYHITGSRILSRSFRVERWEGEVEQDGEHVPEENSKEDTQANTSIGSAMDVDGSGDDDRGVDEESSDRDSDEADIEDALDIAMVPMADLLNARYDSVNAKLFYEEHHLRMVTTKPIKAGEQIFNTYGDPPNSDLLRRYGHVDLGALGNPHDVVEIRADLIVKLTYQRRIDWWLDEGGDDVLILDADPILPAALMSLIRLLLLSQEEWEKTREKGRPPKAKFDRQVDERLLAAESLTLNRRHAIIVRLGEKQLLAGALETLRLMDVALSDDGSLDLKARGVL